jgi:hypothetical protein
MTIETVMLPLFLTAIAGVTLWNIIGAKGHWGIKAGVMVFVSSLCIWVWISLSAMFGWPLDKIPTGTYDISWIEVIEPNKSKSIDGGIYIWIKNMDKTDKHDLFQQQEQHMSQRKPRAYGLPYSRELHKQVMEMKGALKKGQRIRATIKPKDLEGKKGEKPNAVEQEPDIKFHKLPPPKPPKFFQPQQQPDPRPRA